MGEGGSLPTPRRANALQAWVRALEQSQHAAKQPGLTLPALVDRWADRFGDAPALLSDAGTLTYRQLAERVWQYAAWGREQEIGRGDVVALLMLNGVDYLAVWLGLTRLGAVVALLNTNLTGPSLAHCIRVAAPRAIIVGEGLEPAIESVRAVLPGGVACWGAGGRSTLPRRVDLLTPPGGAVAPTADPPAASDRALLIYTSGTTGLPKAAIVSHARLMQWTHWFAGMLDTGPQDRMYNCLPLYHSVGGVVATGAVLVNGGSVVLRQRFSASAFWDDVVRWDCTLFQYIGELCRYLANAPPHPREAAHRLRLACGNGLRPDVWQRFQDRFRIPAILEFYAATEANFSLFNAEGRPGAIGRIPAFLAHRFPVQLVRIDGDTGQPLRDGDGFCTPCRPDEPGEALGKVGENHSGFGGRFEGYTDSTSTGAKLLRNVLAPGDCWYRTGDLMRRDAAGFFFFVDRIGDTFRWKGENVSTTEVEHRLLACPGVAEAVAYGVAVPRSDGRAGMAAIIPAPGFAPDQLFRCLGDTLPSYAVPVFLRVQRSIDSTATFKPRKADLAAAGWDPALVPDPLYVLDRAGGGYVAMTPAIRAQIASGARWL